MRRKRFRRAGREELLRLQAPDEALRVRVSDFDRPRPNGERETLTRRPLDRDRLVGVYLANEPLVEVLAERKRAGLLVKERLFLSRVGVADRGDLLPTLYLMALTDSLLLRVRRP